MISGAHVIIYSPAADEVRAFFRDVLELDRVDAEGGWPIFALPPAELAVHPDETTHHQLYLTCDDIDATMAALQSKGVQFAGGISEQPWGRLTTIKLASGTQIALYQPKHPSPART